MQCIETGGLSRTESDHPVEVPEGLGAAGTEGNGQIGGEFIRPMQPGRSI